MTAIAAGDYQSLAVKADGTVVAWGCGGGFDFGQCSVPAGLSDVAGVAAGSFHSLAVKRDGTVVAWGCSGGFDTGQCTVPGSAAGATAVAAGTWHSVALVANTLPVSADQCKDGGWSRFTVFKNQGDCVSYVATHGKNSRP